VSVKDGPLRLASRGVAREKVQDARRLCLSLHLTFTSRQATLGSNQHVTCQRHTFVIEPYLARCACFYAPAAHPRQGRLRAERRRRSARNLPCRANRAAV